jgi:hypothetical protein
MTDPDVAEQLRIEQIRADIALRHGALTCPNQI